MHSERGGCETCDPDIDHRWVYRTGVPGVSNVPKIIHHPVLHFVLDMDDGYGI
jgi:hypothetical protein